MLIQSNKTLQGDFREEHLNFPEITMNSTSQCNFDTVRELWKGRGFGSTQEILIE